MVAMTSDENALWLPKNAGNLISLFAHSKCWHVCNYGIASERGRISVQLGRARGKYGQPIG